MIKKYPLTFILLISIWTVCMIPLPETPLDEVALMDKWVHFVMFGGLTLCAGSEYLWKHKHTWRMPVLVIGAWLMSALMGGLVELAQAYCTGGRRSGDWFDFLADAIGATLGFLACLIVAKYLSKR